MLVEWINLDRAVERRAAFEEVNYGIAGLEFERFPAIDGSRQNLSRLIVEETVDPKFAVSVDHKNLGCSLSHVALWRRAAERATYTTIAEDDAVFHSRLASWLETFGRNEYDVVLWGWNFDCGLTVDLLPGVSSGQVQCRQDDLRRCIAAFHTLDIHPSLLPLLGAYGTFAYTISPSAARRLLERCLPLSRVGIDNEMSACYPDLRAYVSVPPLAVTPNIKGE